MSNFNELSKEELVELLCAYDNYIKDVVEDLPLEKIDRVPVCIDEFYQNDFEFYRNR